MNQAMPDDKVLYKALLEKDSNFDGVYYVGVKTTGIFCRLTCTARKPKEENVEFFPSVRDALLYGYRPCRICEPLLNSGETPDWLKPLLDEIHKNPNIRLNDGALRERGLEPARVRRWFKKHHGMTFQAYLRTLRISGAFGRIRQGGKVIDAAFESGYESLSGFADSFKKTTGIPPSKSAGRQLINITRIPTPLGPMLAGATDDGVCLLEFVDRRMIETQLNRLKKYMNAELLSGKNRHFDALEKQLKEYFDGRRKEFDVPLVIPGTPFQKKVWDALIAIPYGETRSYSEQAKAIGNPKAVRAVAKANGDNRIGIIIPCHRVIGSNGELTGYGGGLWRKRQLLDLEHIE